MLTRHCAFERRRKMKNWTPKVAQRATCVIAGGGEEEDVGRGTVVLPNHGTAAGRETR